MARRLDLSALIRLVGREKIEEELARTSWYFLVLQENDINRFERITLAEDINPIEWLVYNNRRFLTILIQHMLDYDEHTLPLLEVILGQKVIWQGEESECGFIAEAMSRLENMDEIDMTIIDLVWSYVKNLYVRYFRSLLKTEGEYDEVIVILDGEGSNYINDNLDIKVSEL